MSASGEVDLLIFSTKSLDEILIFVMCLTVIKDFDFQMILYSADFSCYSFTPEVKVYED